MNQGGKVVLGLLALGGVAALVFASEKDAHASSGGPPVQPPLFPPLPGAQPLPPTGGVVIVPPLPSIPGFPGAGPAANAPPPVVAPFPSSAGGGLSIPVPGVVPSPTGTTISLPGIGTFNPATGNVFGPNGVIVGTFDPTTGLFTPTKPQAGGGSTPSAPPVQVTPPLPPIPTQVLPGLTITPGPAPTGAEQPASAAEQPSTVQPDTLKVLTSMLAQEHAPHWRIIPEPSLKAWQQARSLKADGAFGTGTALKLAQEVGALPIIRAWPKGSFKEGKQLPAYQAALRSLAATAPEPRRSQLLAAALREQGQGFGTPETPIHTLITLQDG